MTNAPDIIAAAKKIPGAYQKVNEWVGKATGTPLSKLSIDTPKVGATVAEGMAKFGLLTPAVSKMMLDANPNLTQAELQAFAGKVRQEATRARDELEREAETTLDANSAVKVVAKARAVRGALRNLNSGTFTIDDLLDFAALMHDISPSMVQTLQETYGANAEMWTLPGDK